MTNLKEIDMDEAYLIARMQASLAMARKAAGSAARLIHFELAGRYGLAATAASDPRHLSAARVASSFYEDRHAT